MIAGTVLKCQRTSEASVFSSSLLALSVSLGG
jgi:hypothetical protein